MKRTITKQKTLTSAFNRTSKQKIKLVFIKIPHAKSDLLMSSICDAGFLLNPLHKFPRVRFLATCTEKSVMRDFLSIWLNKIQVRRLTYGLGPLSFNFLNSRTFKNGKRLICNVFFLLWSWLLAGKGKRLPVHCSANKTLGSLHSWR